MTLGEKLQYLRKEKGISQEQLAGIFFDACLICAVHKDYEEKKILQAAYAYECVRGEFTLAGEVRGTRTETGRERSGRE